MTAIWANAVGKARLGVRRDVPLNLVPRPAGVADTLAGSTDGQKAAKVAHLRRSLVKRRNGLPKSALRLPSHGDLSPERSDHQNEDRGKHEEGDNQSVNQCIVGHGRRREASQDKHHAILAGRHNAQEQHQQKQGVISESLGISRNLSESRG